MLRYANILPRPGTRSRPIWHLHGRPGELCAPSVSSSACRLDLLILNIAQSLFSLRVSHIAKTDCSGDANQLGFRWLSCTSYCTPNEEHLHIQDSHYVISLINYTRCRWSALIQGRSSKSSSDGVKACWPQTNSVQLSSSSSLSSKLRTGGR